MFDLGWSKLIIIAMLAIVVVGPKDLPALLRAIGKFVGQIRRQADEFRRQFDDAMRDTELDQIRKDVEEIRSSTEASVRDIGRSAEDSIRPLETAASDITHMGNGTIPDARTADTFMPESAAHPVPAISSEIATESLGLPPTPTMPTTAPSQTTKVGAG